MKPGPIQARWFALIAVVQAVGCGSSRDAAPVSTDSPPAKAAVVMRKHPVQPPKFTLESPTKGVRVRLGEPIRVKGTLTLSRDYVMFEKKVVIENRQLRNGKPVLLHSQLVPLQEVGTGVYAFDKELTGSGELPKQAGKYQIAVVAIGLNRRDETQETALGHGPDRIESPAETVTYEAIP
jgi:hypothetical protein